MPLVSTYKKREVQALEPLPPDWTEHAGPSGQMYYYNSQTQQSTYQRPTAATTFAAANPQAAYPYAQNIAPAPTASYISLSDFNPSAGSQFLQEEASQNPRGGISRQNFQDRRRNEPQDRPKHRYKIPNCEPWVLVKTKLGRRFVHNLETKESLWHFPPDVFQAVKAFDRKEREKRERRERGEDSESEAEVAVNAEQGKVVPLEEQAQDEGRDSDSEYTEVTDSEGEDGEEGASKRPRLASQDDDQPVEFDEDDIAYQLQAMEEDRGLDNDDDHDMQQMNDEEDAQDDLQDEPEDLTEEDSTQLFRDLLDDFNVNPYSTFERTIEDGFVIQDDRWTALSSMKARRECWAEWSKESIAALQERKTLQTKSDPKIPYMQFLQDFATPKLYWPEFKRKYRKEAAMKDTKVQDRDKESLFRDHVKRLQLSPSTQKSDLTTLLKAQPLSLLNRSTTINTLPSTLHTDLRFITLAPKTRDPLIEAYISTLAPPPSEAGAAIEEDVAAATAKAKDRQRREEALRERTRRVEEEKLRSEKELRYGKGLLREEEREIERAMVVGKSGIRGQLRD